MGQRLRVGIVGGGVAGCAAAVMLARDGHDVELLEHTPRLGPVGAGILLQPSGQAVLAELGLLAAIERSAARIEALVAWTHRGRLLSRLAYRDHSPGMHALGVYRADLFAAMHEACVAAGVRVRLDVRASSTRRERGRRCVIAGEGEWAREAGSYDLVVAADGSRSRLRASSGLRSFTHEYRPAALWAMGVSDWPRDELVQYTRGNAMLCGLLPMGGGRCSFFWGIDRDHARESAGVAMRGSFDAWRERVIELVPAAEQMLRPLTAWSDLMFASYRAVVMPRVTGDAIVFIGDAAHSSGPHLGQGANLALLDAAGLRDALRATRSLGEALAHYEARQRWRNAYYSAVTAALMPTFQGGHYGIGPARDFALPLLQRVPRVRKLMLRTLCGVW